MADQGSVLKEFLVALGFKVDEDSLKKFNTRVQEISKGVLGLGTVVAGTAAALEAGVSAMAEKLEDLYYASKRTGATVQNLQALRFAAGQVGVGADRMLGAIETFARAQRLNPGLTGLLNSMGIQTAGRQTTEVLQDFIARLRTMAPYMAAQYAQMFGIDPDTLLLLEQGLEKLNSAAEDKRKRLRDAGVDVDDLAEKSKNFQNDLRHLEDDLEIFGTLVEKRLLGPIDAVVKQLDQWLIGLNNLDKETGGASTVVIALGTALLGVKATLSVLGRLFGVTAKAAAASTTEMAAAATSAEVAATKLTRIPSLLGPALLATYLLYEGMKGGGKVAADIEEAKKRFGSDSGALQQWWKQYSAEKAEQGNQGFEAWVKNNLGDSALNALRLPGQLHDKLFGPPKGADGNAVPGYTPGVEHFVPGSPGAGGPNTEGTRPPAAQPGSSAPPEQSIPTPGGSRPLGVRSNNPGNVQAHGHEAVFATVAEGLDVMAKTLTNYARQGLTTIDGIVHKYAGAQYPGNTPQSEENYKRRLEAELGVNRNTGLNLFDPQRLGQLMYAMSGVEQGGKFWARQAFDEAAGTRLGATAANRNATVNQTTNITVHGAGNANDTAQTVGAQQSRVNQDLVRNFQGAMI